MDGKLALQADSKSQSKYWMATVFDTSLQLEELLSPYRFLFYQLERCPETQNLHYQVYVGFNKNVRFNYLQNLLKTDGHSLRLYVRRGKHAQAMAYCTKEETCVDECKFIDYDENDAPEQGRRTDLETPCEELKKGRLLSEVALEFPIEFVKYSNGLQRLEKIIKRKKFVTDKKEVILRDWQREVLEKLDSQDERKILWIVDGKGNQGKSWLAKYLVTNKICFFSDGGNYKDLSYAYDFQEYAVFDFPRTTEQNIPYDFIEKLKDGCLFVSKYESESKFFKSVKVICFSNFYPDITKMSSDRWVVRKLTESSNSIHNFLTTAE